MFDSLAFQSHCNVSFTGELVWKEVQYYNVPYTSTYGGSVHFFIWNLHEKRGRILPCGQKFVFVEMLVILKRGYTFLNRKV